MASIAFSELLTTIYVLVDDWYQGQAKPSKLKPGQQAEFSDSEVLTLLVAHDYLPYPGETQFLGHMRANYLGLFPKLLDQSQYNRRARSLRLVLEQLRWAWAQELGVMKQTQLLLDTKPLPVMGYKRSKRHSDFAGSAGYGHCVARNLDYFGYKLVTLTTLDGLPVIYDLVPANLDEREAAETVLLRVCGCDIFADKGFIGGDWQVDIRTTTGNRVWTAKRVNQREQNPLTFDKLLNSVRERIEGAFNEVQNTGRNLERLLAKSILGLCTRVAAKLTSHVLRLLLRHKFAIDVLTFEQALPAPAL